MHNQGLLQLLLLIYVITSCGFIVLRQKAQRFSKICEIVFKIRLFQCQRLLEITVMDVVIHNFGSLQMLIRLLEITVMDIPDFKASCSFK